MAKLKDYYGKYCESEYEYALLAFLEKNDGFMHWEHKLIIVNKKR